MDIITQEPMQHVINVTPTVLLVPIIPPVLNVTLQEKETIVSAQMECGITPEFVKIVHTNVLPVLILLMIVTVTVLKTELEMIVTVQMLIMTTMKEQNAQNVVVNVQNVMKMVV
jgi:hypothetical protein